MESSVFDFSAALYHLKNGERLARSGWNGKSVGLRGAEPKEKAAGLTTGFYKKHGNVSSAWLPNTDDLLAEDWAIAE